VRWQAQKVKAMEQFIMGAITMASVVIALFFLRFWRDTGDRLFALFALAFLLLGITRAGLATSQATAAAVQPRPQAAAPQNPGAAPAAGVDDAQGASEANTSWYWVRLAAFVLILIAIIDKNRR
jgi:hypothetical protein